MPPINEYKCNKCGFSFPRGWGGYMYVEIDKDFLEHRLDQINNRLFSLVRKRRILEARIAETEARIREACKLFEERIIRLLREQRDVLGALEHERIEECRNRLENMFLFITSYILDPLRKRIEDVDGELRQVKYDKEYLESLKRKLEKTSQKYLRVPCPHPAEDSTVRRILGENAPRELIEERTGFNSYCICLDCLHQFEADLRDEKANEWRFYYGYPKCIDVVQGKPIKMKDERKCPKCGSTNVKTVFELIGKPCPKCKEGIIEEIVTGIVS